MKFATAYEGKIKSSIDFKNSPSLTKQAHKDECDVNRIMKKYEKTGVVAFTNKYEAHYGDVTSMEFTSAMNKLQSAQEMFSELPSEIRNRFANEPSDFLAYVQDPNNHHEMIKLGLATPLPDPNNIDPPPTNPPPVEPPQPA